MDLDLHRLPSVARVFGRAHPPVFILFAIPISTEPLPRCTMNAASAPEPGPYARTLQRMEAAYELLDHTGKTPLLKAGNWATDGFRCATGYDRPNAAVRESAQRHTTSCAAGAQKPFNSPPL